MPAFNEADRDQYGGDIIGIQSAGGRAVLRSEYDSPSFLMFGRGDIVLKKDPSEELHFGWMALDDSSESMTTYVNAINDGFQFAMYDDFSVRPELREIWKKNVDGRITLGGQSKNTMAIMFMSLERFDRNRKKELRFSDEIQKSVEQKLAENQEASKSNNAGPYHYSDTMFSIEDAESEVRDTKGE